MPLVEEHVGLNSPRKTQLTQLPEIRRWKKEKQIFTKCAQIMRIIYLPIISLKKQLV